MRKLAPYLLGPLTGFLVARALHHRREAPVLASLYVLATALWLLEEGPLTAWALRFYGGLLRP